jgi:hypothetical protein
MDIMTLPPHQLQKVKDTLRERYCYEINTRFEEEVGKNREDFRAKKDSKFAEEVVDMENWCCCSDEQYDTWEAEIKSLKPKKRKNWKGYIVDKWGVRTGVFYKDGEFWDKGAQGARGVVKGVCKIIPQRVQDEELHKDGASGSALTLSGFSVQVAAEMKRAVREWFDVKLTDESYKIMCQMITDIELDTQDQIKKSNLTGAHKSLHGKPIKCRTNPYGHR